MGFKKVYRSLLEIFPQVDARVLRAVAIEHSKDADKAVEAVLVEIIPFLADRPSTPLTGSISEGQTSEALVGVVATSQTMDAPSVNTVGSADGQNGHDMDGGSQANKDSDEGKSWADGNNSLVWPSLLTAYGPRTSPVENNVRLVLLPDMHGSDVEELDKGLSNNTAPKMETTSGIVGTEDESTLNASMSQSSQTHIMEALGEIIADAGNNKKTMFSAMESVISLMREVELKEQAAEQAKLEVAMGGADILAKLEYLKQTLQHAKESNSMHAGEVYGERAVLATELRELQSRLLSLTAERDKSLSVLDEMRQTLEVRLAAAENEIESAEQEKSEKGNAAMKALADQELIMEKVVQDSKILKQQAEENAKLQEFLVDRGRVVDMLQGEIAVICKDVRLLKESFDDNVPFSKSLSSSQTSCILASSTSSSKNPNPEDLEPEGADSLVTQSERDAISGFAEQSSEGESTRDYRKTLVDDGWELFDDHDGYP